MAARRVFGHPQLFQQCPDFPRYRCVGTFYSRRSGTEEWCATFTCLNLDACFSFRRMFLNVSSSDDVMFTSVHVRGSCDLCADTLNELSGCVDTSRKLLSLCTATKYSFTNKL